MKKLDFRRKEVRDFLNTEVIFNGYKDMYFRFRVNAWQDKIITPEWEELEKSQIIKLKNKLLERLSKGEWKCYLKKSR